MKSFKLLCYDRVNLNEKIIKDIENHNILPKYPPQNHRKQGKRLLIVVEILFLPEKPMMRPFQLVLFLGLCVVGIISCAESNQEISNGERIDDTFELTPIPDTDLDYAIAKDALGAIAAEGAVRNGVKNGTWLYYSGDELPVKSVSYVNGYYHGPYLEFNDQGTIKLAAHYRNNKLHGPWASYRFSRPTVSANYKDGELDGLYVEFDPRDGSLKRETTFKEGLRDGFVRYYNKEGEVTAEYEFRNDEQVGTSLDSLETAN